ncbi:MAG: AAA family ATPase [Micropruina sp.]|nr:AAA family ATPase [Micropruina sp.]
MLGPDDVLAFRPRRITVAGTSGAGKSVLARRISALTGSAYTEIDALFHGPDWTTRPTFEADVEAVLATDAWVIDWQYGFARPLIADRAELCVFLDLPRRRVLGQVTRRTVRRRLTRERLWGVVTEPPLWTFVTDRDHIIRWSWRTWPKTRRLVAELAQSHPRLPLVRLQSHEEAERWLTGPLAGSLSHRS